MFRLSLQLLAGVVLVGWQTAPCAAQANQPKFDFRGRWWRDLEPLPIITGGVLGQPSQFLGGSGGNGRFGFQGGNFQGFQGGNGGFQGFNGGFQGFQGGNGFAGFRGGFQGFQGGLNPVFGNFNGQFGQFAGNAGQFGQFAGNHGQFGQFVGNPGWPNQPRGNFGGWNQPPLAGGFAGQQFLGNPHQGFGVLGR